MMLERTNIPGRKPISMVVVPSWERVNYLILISTTSFLV
uniref:Uncharacterized protein n=1 Tax=Arundo donax TaxID=35708 RepID=A0A0A9HKC4_ARUDO